MSASAVGAEQIQFGESDDSVNPRGGSDDSVNPATRAPKGLYDSAQGENGAKLRNCLGGYCRDEGGVAKS
jgi:hypothetical protein